jgi:hypothetical protein
MAPTRLCAMRAVLAQLHGRLELLERNLMPTRH